MAALALWCVGPCEVALRPGAMGEGVLVETLFSGISRGTERLVFQGKVPETEHERMRGPAQEGDFPFPVKYGYCAVGRVAEGEHAGSVVFALHPHQSEFRLPETALVSLPAQLPPERAILGSNMETALNVLWDSGAGAGDRIAVIGAGVVGLLSGYLAAKLPGAEVTMVDINPERVDIATKLGCAFSQPETAPRDQDVVLHLSATPEGLETAIDCAAPDATIVEGSWYGSGATLAPLGGAFHSRRLRLISSQVGQLPPYRRPRWTFKRRLIKALNLVCDPTLDELVNGETSFDDLPACYGDILSDPATLCHRIRYER